MNTQNIKELEDSQNKVINQWNAFLLEGIKNRYVNTEDSTPFTTICGHFDKESGLRFAQDLANQMNIRILINRLETWYKNDDSVLHLIYDINPNQQNNLPIEKDPHYNDKLGIEVVPYPVKKLKK